MILQRLGAYCCVVPSTPYDAEFSDANIVCTGKQGGYSFFSGVDASRAFLTGEFADDLNDNVTDFTESQMHGLVHWRDFYLKVSITLSDFASCKRMHSKDTFIPSSDACCSTLDCGTVLLQCPGM